MSCDYVVPFSHLKPNATLRLLDDEAEEHDELSSQAETDSGDEEDSLSDDASDESDPFVDHPKSRQVLLMVVSDGAIEHALVLVLTRERQ